MQNWWANKMRSSMWTKFIGKNHSWKQLSLIGDETVINLQSTKVYVFSDSVLCLGRIFQHAESNEAWKKRIEGITTDKSYRDFDGINGEPTEFEWNIFPGFTMLQLCGEINVLLSYLVRNTRNFHRKNFIYVNVHCHLL